MKMDFNCSAIPRSRGYYVCQALNWTPVVVFIGMIIIYHVWTGTLCRARDAVAFLQARGFLETKLHLRRRRIESVFIVIPHGCLMFLSVKSMIGPVVKLAREKTSMYDMNFLSRSLSNLSLYITD